MTAPARPSLDEIVRQADRRPPLDAIVAAADREPESLGDKIAGGLSAAYQGLTLGAGNKITAAVRALANAGGNPALIPATFPAEFAASNAPLGQFRQNHPVASVALEMAGSLPWMAVGAGARPAATLLGRVGQLAKTGAGYGAASGALSADRPEDILPGAAIGGVGGALTAPLVGGLLGAYRGTMGAEAKADRLLAGALRSGGVEPTQVTVGANEPTTIMDIGSRGPVAWARAARNVPAASAGQKIDDLLTTRAQQTATRVQKALEETSGLPREDFRRTTEQMIAARKQAADPLYKQANAAPPLPLEATAGEGTPALRDILQRPSMQMAQKYAAGLAAERGEPPASNVFTALGLKPSEIAAFRQRNPAFQNVGGDVVPYQTLHEYKMQLDDILGYAKTGGTLPDGSAATRTKLRAIEGTRRDLLALMDAHNPAYQEARAQFAGASALKNAFENGREFMRSGRMAAEGADELAKLSSSEQEMWRRGGMTALQDKITKLAANPDLPEASRKVNVVQRTLGSSEDGAKAKLLFGSDKGYQDFMARMGPEAIYPKTNAALLNQSTTAAQRGEGKGVGMMDAFYAAKALQGSPWGVAHTAARMSPGRGMTPDLAEAIGSRVTKTGSALNEYLATLGLSPIRRGPTAAARGAGIASGEAVGGLLRP